MGSFNLNIAANFLSEERSDEGRICIISISLDFFKQLLLGT